MAVTVDDLAAKIPDLTPEGRAALERVPESARAQFEQMLADPVELHPELEKFYEPEGGLGPCIRHPLYYSMLHHPRLNAMANAALAAKRKMLAEYTAEGDWEGCVWTHERPWRLNAFLAVAAKLPTARYWKLLAGLWVDSENIVQNLAEWREALEGRAQPWRMMDEAERAKLRDYRRQRVLLIYRGFCHDGAHEGLSWTTSRARAEWFARRFADLDGSGAARIAIGICDPRHVIAVFDGRGENEVVIDWDDVLLDSIKEVSWRVGS